MFKSFSSKQHFSTLFTCCSSPPELLVSPLRKQYSLTAGSDGKKTVCCKKWNEDIHFSNTNVTKLKRLSFFFINPHLCVKTKVLIIKQVDFCWCSQTEVVRKLLVGREEGWRRFTLTSWRPVVGRSPLIAELNIILAE